jgi:hypothetical protein
VDCGARGGRRIITISLYKRKTASEEQIYHCEKGGEKNESKEDLENGERGETWLI